MPKINLYPEMNAKIADFLLDCEDNGMLLYAGTYIKKLERQLAEYRTAEEQGNIARLPIAPETPVYSIEYCCGLYENKIGMCHKGLCSQCNDSKLYVMEATAQCSCKISELGKSVFLNHKVAERIVKERCANTRTRRCRD